MVKTQVQIPDELYRKAKQIATEREISLAEVVRRGLEYMTAAYPPISGAESELPVLDPNSFVEDFDSLDFKALSSADQVQLRSEGAA